MHALGPGVAVVGFMLLAGCRTATDSTQPVPHYVAPAAASGQANPFVGRWEPTEQSHGGISAVIDLHEDGTFVSGMAVQDAMKYSLQGNRLSLTSRRESREEGDDPLEFEVAFVGDRMTVAGESTKTRLGVAVPGSPIIGVWTYEHYTGGPAYERYGADGTADLRIALPGETRGSYTVTGTTLTLETGGEEDVRSFVLDGDLLTLTAQSGPSRTFRRTSAWYEFPLPAAEAEKLRERVLRKQGIALPPRGKQGP